MTTQPHSMLPQKYRIIQRVQDTQDTFTLTLEPSASQDLLEFAPGQFNMLYTFGVGEVPISISGDLSHSKYLVHTIRSVGTVTENLSELQIGDSVGIRGPFGSGWPIKESHNKDVLIIAGGIGLAPLRPVLYHVLAQRKEYGDIGLLYGSRSPRDLLYRQELHEWRGRFDMEVDITVDHASGNWQGNVGVVTSLLSRKKMDVNNTIAMLCGPEIMMRFTIMELQKQGFPLESIYISMERNMKCAIGHCGHCQFGPTFICKNGPVFRFDHIQEWFRKKEI